MTRIEENADEAEGLNDVVRGVRAVDARLDEVARARIAAGLDRYLDARDVEHARREAARRGRAEPAWRWLAPLAGVGLAAWLMLARDARRAGEPAVPRAAIGDIDRLEVPAGARARARLGRADLTVLGPAQLEVTRVVASDMTLRLSSGTLVGDYDGHAGGRLRVETPRLIAQIVGTRFAIEATPAHARVSVAHGRVVVREAAAPEGSPEITVEAGQTWEVGRARALPTPAPVVRLLAEDTGEETAPAAVTDPPAKPPRARAPTPAAAAADRTARPQAVLPPPPRTTRPPRQRCRNRRPSRRPRSRRPLPRPPRLRCRRPRCTGAPKPPCSRGTARGPAVGSKSWSPATRATPHRTTRGSSWRATRWRRALRHAPAGGSTS